MNFDRMPRFLLFAILSLTHTSFAQSPLLLLKESIRAPDFRLSYGTNELNFGELRLPKASGPFPVMVLIHGGCWKAELPGLDPRATSLDLLRPIAAALPETGIATWNIEYHRVGNEGGGWPGTYHDIGRAIDFLRTIAAKHSLDTNRVIVGGHSAGGQLAFWAAARPKLPRENPLFAKDPLPLKGVVDLDGPIDLKAGAPFTEQFCGFPAIHEFMGGSPDSYPERYSMGSANTYLPLGINQLIVVGSLLGGIRDQVSNYTKAAESKGDHVTVLDLQKTGHFGFLFPDSDSWKSVQDRIGTLAQ
jgi:acetyl esterase/lipase